MNDKQIDVLLKLELEAGHVIAYQQFSNISTGKIFLDEQTICFYKKTYGDVFLIKDEKGKEVAYKGMMVSRKIEPEYFQQLNPGEKIETSVSISEVYKVQKGKRYKIQYCGYNPYYKNEQKTMEI